MLLRTFVVRITATVCHLGAGLRSVPENYRVAVLVIDSVSMPELLPGYRGQDPLRVQYYWKRLKDDISVVKRCEQVVALLILFVPAWLYRFSVKSTCWLYGALIYVVVPRKGSKTNTDYARYLADQISVRTFEKFSRLMAAVTLVVVILAKVPQIVSTIANAPVTVVSVCEYIFVLDIDDIKPWQWFNIASAIFTMVLWFLADKLQVELRHYRSIPQAARSISRLAYLTDRIMAWRNICGVLWWATIGLHSLLWLSPLQHHLWSIALDCLKAFYGSSFPPTVH